MRKLLALLLIATFALAAGCSKKASPVPPPPSTETNTVTNPAPTLPEPKDPAPDGPRAAEFLPKPGSPYNYYLSDGTASTEYFFSDGDRLIGSYNGKAYVTWFATKEGAWRPDPQGPGLLRYLPAVLKHGTAWKQTSGSDEVYFLLEDRGSCRTDRDYNHPVPCWQLSMLNRQELTVLHFAPELGVVYAQSANYKAPAESYIKRIGPENQPVETPPAREDILKTGATLPAGPLPPVTSITPDEFHAAVKAVRTRAGAVLEIDLNGDGKMEVLEGPVGSWHTAPLRFYGSDGLLRDYTFSDLQMAPSGVQHRVDVVKLKGVEHPVLMYQLGYPGTWHQTDFKLMNGDQLQSVWGWHPKTNLLWMASVRVSEDGVIVAEGDPASMGGYLLRQYSEVFRTTEGPFAFAPKLVNEEIERDAYPETEADLLTATLVAQWFGLEHDLARYVPDATVREALIAAKISKPNYTFSAAQVGRLTEKRFGNNPPIPDIEQSETVALDQPVDFLVEVGQYEGYNAYIGKVTFGREADGRTVIRAFELVDMEFVY